MQLQRSSNRKSIYELDGSLVTLFDILLLSCRLLILRLLYLTQIGSSRLQPQPAAHGTLLKTFLWRKCEIRGPWRRIAKVREGFGARDEIAIINRKDHNHERGQRSHTVLQLLVMGNENQCLAGVCSDSETTPQAD